MAPRVGVVVFPGSNCEHDAVLGLERAGARADLVWHGDDDLSGFDAVVLPGGFAHGDYLRPGGLARFSPVMAAVARLAADGGPVVGICNGFQVLTEAGLLPGAFLQNAALKFLGKDVFLKVETSQSIFTNRYEAGQTLRLPIAHHEGNYYADEATLARLEGNGQIAFRYCSEAGAVSADANPNGAAHNIAGVFNEAKTILGMMPHPERLADAALGGSDGRPLFEALAEALS